MNFLMSRFYGFFNLLNGAVDVINDLQTTLAKQASAIDTLNSKMLIKSTNIKFGMCNINCFRVGNIAMIQCVSGTVDIIADSTLFTIPEGYRPCADIDFPTRSPAFGAGIGINGNFVMYGAATNIPLRFTVAYIASD